MWDVHRRIYRCYNIGNVHNYACEIYPCKTAPSALTYLSFPCRPVGARWGWSPLSAHRSGLGPSAGRVRPHQPAPGTVTVRGWGGGACRGGGGVEGGGGCRGGGALIPKPTFFTYMIFLDMDILLIVKLASMKTAKHVAETQWEGRACQNFDVALKPIFHQNAKYLASGVGVGQCTQRQNFALPNAKHTNTLVYFALADAHFLRYPTPNPRRQT